MMTNMLEQRRLCVGHHQQQQSQQPPMHRSRKRRRNQIVSTASTCLLSAVAASSSSMARAYSGGYLAYPMSRNYIAYDSASILPSAELPEFLLPKEEPTPQNINSGQRCGMTDGGERDYNKPKSRANSILPLNIQEVYVSGSDIEVTVRTAGLEGGGHFDFHVCPLEYPEEPTEECFQKNPLEFVKDHYYGAVKDELHPERAYVPFEHAFEKIGNSMTLVQSGETDGIGSSMMEFKYTFKLPENKALWTDFSTSGQQEIIVSYSDAAVFSVLVPLHDIDSLVDSEILPGMTQLSAEEPMKDDGDANDVDSSAPYKGKIQASGTTGNGAVLISAMVTDGKGKTIIVSMNETPIIHESGPVVEATAICTFGDVSIYGQGVTDVPEEIKKICGSVAQTGSKGDSDSEKDVITAADSAGNTTTPLTFFPSTKYALLRWHYQTARDCFPSGYDSYSWPKEWGQWEPQWSGECDGNESQVEYWNCAEVLILNTSSPEPSIAETASPTIRPTRSVYTVRPSVAQTASPTSRPTRTISNVSLVAVNDGAITGVDQAVKIDVLANDEVSGDVKPQIKDSTSAVNGLCQVMNDEVLYTPNVGFTGWDRCEYTVCVGGDVCDKAFVKIKVFEATIPETEVLTANPIVNPDEAVVLEGSWVSIDVLKNDEVADGDSLEIFSASSPLHGSVEVVNNHVRYTSRAGFTGTDSFMYSACDNANRCESADVVVNVIAEVLAVDDSVTTMSAPILIDVTTNDYSSSVSASLIVTHVNDGKHGSCSITASNKVRYIPNEMYSGWDWCDYKVCAGSACDQGRVDIHVLSDTPPPSLSPVESMQQASIKVDFEKVYAQDDGVVTFINEPIVVDVTVNDFVKGMDTLSIIHTGGSEHGACEVTNNNKVLYSPNTDFEGSDKCGYIVCDVSSNMCDEGILRIDVTNGSRQFHQKDRSPLLPSPNSRLRSGISLTANENSNADGTIVLSASADAFITIEFPDTNFGFSAMLFVSSASSSAGLRDTMLMFNVPSSDESFCGNGIESAVVSMYSIAYAAVGGTLVTTSNKFWTEADVTWNESPVGDGIVITDLGSVEVDTWYDIDVLSAVTLGDPLSIRIISPMGGESIALYASRDHQDASLHPVLKITCLL